MKALLKRLAIFSCMLAVLVASLFGCEFSFAPKAKILIVKDTNHYNNPYNAVSLIENIQKKMNVVQAFDVKGVFQDESTVDFAIIKNETLKSSSFSMLYNKKEDYELKINLRNEIMYFKAPLTEMGIDTTLNLGIKESVDVWAHYLPLFLTALGFNDFINITEEDYNEIFNNKDYLNRFIDYLLNLGKNTFMIKNDCYLINIAYQDNIEVYVNMDFTLKTIKTNEFEFNFSYPKEGEYVLEYPGEIVGISYVTLQSIEETLGDTFENLLQ